MNATRRIFSLFAGLLAGAFLSATQAGDQARSIETFDGSGSGGRNSEAVSHWKWSQEEKRNAKSLSRLEIGKGEGANGAALKVSIFKTLPQGPAFYAVWTTGLDYLPPDATAIRMRVRVVSGSFALTVGSPTVYFGNSDVWASPQVLETGGWQTIEFSLVSGLERNFRRAIYSAASPDIHYTRWIQEPLRIMVGADSRGELWLDDIELVLSGKGSAFPAYREETIHPLSSGDLGQAFTFSTDAKEFDLARTPGKEALRKPAVLNRPDQKREELEARLRGLEEMSFIGIPVSCPEGTNGFRVTMKMAHQSRLEELVVDLLVLVAQGGIFPWTKQPAGIPGGFDYCLSPSRTKKMSWGFYHARRIVSNGEWSTFVVPFEDFVCAYGSGGLSERQQRRQPLVAGQVVALAMVPSFRQSAAETFFTIRSIEAVRLDDSKVVPVSYPKASP